MAVLKPPLQHWSLRGNLEPEAGVVFQQAWTLSLLLCACWKVVTDVQIAAAIWLAAAVKLCLLA